MKRKELSVLLYKGLVQGVVSLGLGEHGNGLVCRIGQYEFRPDPSLIDAGTDLGVAASLADSILSMEDKYPYLYGYFTSFLKEFVRS